MDLYIRQIQNCSDDMNRVINCLVESLYSSEGTVFLTGIGKSWHVARKSVATWQSLGICCHPILIQDMFHGDMGVLKPGDVIIYLSNSGNTEELLTVARYVKERFSVRQISISANLNSKLGQIIESFCINGPIQEADELNMAPSVSSVLFMMTLDLLGIRLAEKRGIITKEQFRRFHPGGTLGKDKI